MGTIVMETTSEAISAKMMVKQKSRNIIAEMPLLIAMGR